MIQPPAALRPEDSLNGKEGIGLRKVLPTRKAHTGRLRAFLSEREKKKAVS